MANNKETQTTPETQTTAEKISADANTMYSVKVPRGNEKGDSHQYVSVNGKVYLLTKGKTNQVPKFIKDEYERGERARDRCFEAKEARITKDEDALM